MSEKIEIDRTDDVLIQGNILFSQMLLSDRVLAGLTSNNFIRPSPIQLRAIPLGRCGLGKEICCVTIMFIILDAFCCGFDLQIC